MEVGSGDETGTTLARFDGVGEPEQLDVEGRVGGVGDGVDVERLTGRRPRRDVVYTFAGPVLCGLLQKC
jgi:hypothetical protein